jgi:hypothetical protein
MFDVEEFSVSVCLSTRKSRRRPHGELIEIFSEKSGKKKLRVKFNCHKSKVLEKASEKPHIGKTLRFEREKNKSDSKPTCEGEGKKCERDEKSKS